MAVAFTFPGQGSQHIGMGKELAENFSQARDVFNEVDDALGQKLSHLMFSGSESELTLTANAQPALMAVSMAIIRILQNFGFNISEKISYVAGHSLGEYSALCAVNTFSVADTARLLRKRGQAMQKAVPVGLGAMAAIIGMELEKIAEICQNVKELGLCQIANDNGGSQLVISGLKPAVEKACQMASERGAKRAIMLPVSAPFHSALMKPAALEMRQALDNVPKSDPLLPLIANVCALPVSSVNEICNLLVEQITARVRWRETIEWLGKNKVDTIYEIGSGKVLSGLARRINRDLVIRSVSNVADIENAAKEFGL